MNQRKRVWSLLLAGLVLLSACQKSAPAPKEDTVPEKQEEEQQEEVPLERLLQESFILTEKGCNYRNVFEKDLMDAGYVLKCIAEVGHTSYIIKAVARQLGIGLLPVFTLKDALEKGEIALIGVKDYRISLSIQVIYNTQRMLSLPLKVFLNELQHFYIPE